MIRRISVADRLKIEDRYFSHYMCMDNIMYISAEHG